MPKNFFIEKLLSIRRMSGHENSSMICEACASVGEMDANATVYCVECNQKFCDDCAKYHKKYQMSRSHEQVKITECDADKAEEIFRTSASAVCEKHQDQNLNVFCRDCKMAICVVCFIASHKQHDCSDISDVVDKMRQQMATGISCLNDGVGKLREMQISVEQQKQEFTKRVEETEQTITKRAQELILKIERDKQTLLEELSKEKYDTMKQLDNVHHEIVQQILIMESLKKYTEELSLKGSPGDIARETTTLENRFKELLKFEVIEHSRDDLHSIDVKFTQTSVNNDNIIGKVDVTVTAKG